MTTRMTIEQLEQQLSESLSQCERARVTVQLVSEVLAEMRDENEKLRIALADSFFLKPGEIPSSANGLISSSDLDAAEKRNRRRFPWG